MFIHHRPIHLVTYVCPFATKFRLTAIILFVHPLQSFIETKEHLPDFRGTWMFSARQSSSWTSVFLSLRSICVKKPIGQIEAFRRSVLWEQTAEKFTASLTCCQLRLTDEEGRNLNTWAYLIPKNTTTGWRLGPFLLGKSTTCPLIIPCFILGACESSSPWRTSQILICTRTKQSVTTLGTV